MFANKKIAVFTGARSEYGLLSGLIKRIHESSKSQLNLLVGGMHLSHEYGYTIKEIQNDNIPITEKIEFLLSSETATGISKSIGLAIIGASEYFSRNRPDMLVILGDRFEALAIAQAALIAKIPISHIHGGEITQGAVDDSIRHSITKMSNLHFTSTEEHRRRVIQLGEKPKNVFNVGAPGVDNIKKTKLHKRENLSEHINFRLDKKFFMISYHPVTLSSDSGVQALKNLLDELEKYQQYQIIMSYPNADVENKKIVGLLESYHKNNPKRIHLTHSLGQQNFLSCLKHCELIIGNSSSAIIEAPSLNIPTVNIGDRQKGRITGETVINCRESKQDISKAIKTALSVKFKKICIEAKNPYGDGNSSQRILNIIEKTSLDDLVFKQFHDIDHNGGL